jgi:hypothetical protein
MSYLEDKVTTEILKHAVSQHISCSVTGQVLDYRTAVLVESGKTGRTLACLSPDGWRLRKDALMAAMPDLKITNAPKD